MGNGTQQAPQKIGDTLAPLLIALEGRLNAAIANDSLTFDTATLGVDGAAIIQLMQSALGVSSVAISGSVLVGADGDYLKVTALMLQTPVVGVTQTGVVVYFGVSDSALTIQMQVAGGPDWYLSTSFPNLASSWTSNIVFDTDSDTDTLFILSSIAGPLLGYAGVLPAPQLPQGLAMEAKLDITDGPLKSLVSVVAGLTEPVIASGPCSQSELVESFSLLGPLPDFSFSVPVLPPLSFTNPYISVAANLDQGQGNGVYQSYVEAGAQVSFGTSGTLPLMFRVPGMSQGWMLGLQDDSSIGIADLAGFFGDFTGLSFLSQLPDTITTLTQFELQSFLVQMNAANTDFVRLRLGLGTPTSSFAQNSWTIIPGTGDTPILALTGLALHLDVAKYPSGVIYGGRVSGTFNLSDTLQIQAQVGFPVATSLWTVNCSSYAALPDLTDFARFLGGQSLAGMVPNGLGALTSYNLQEFSAVYNPSTSTLQTLGVALVSSNSWTIVSGQLVIQSLTMQFSVADPLGTDRSLTGRVAGVIALGATATLNVSIYKVNAADSWHFSVLSDYIPLPSLGDIAALAGGNIASLLPDALNNNTFSLSDITILADVSNQKMQKFGFTLSTADSWPIITDILTVTEAGVCLLLDWTGAAGTRVVTGCIWGNVNFCQADFGVQANYANDNWDLLMALLDGSSLTLQNLVTAFDAALWAGLENLGVPNVSLTSASINYATGTGSYALSGTVGPADGSTWTIPIGVANIDIKSIGSHITCIRGSDGTPTNKEVYVTGAFSVGSVNFTISYLAGSNLTMNAQLVGDAPVSVSSVVSSLCSPDAGSVTWTSEFESLNAITISNVEAALVLGANPSFQITGQIEIESVMVDCLFLVQQINSKWEFALAVKVDTNWNLSGFTDAYAPFNLDKQTWMVAASSFTQSGFSFPPSFQTPYIGVINRGLDVYASFQTSSTYSTISTVQSALPSGAIPATLTVHGLLADPLSASFLEVIISADPNGLPIFGCDDIRVAAFALRLTPAPAFVLHGDFVFKSISNPDGSFFHLIVDLAVSAQEIRIDFEQQPQQGAIYTWQDAFGISALDVSLLSLGIGITDTPLAIDGTFGGQVTFEQSYHPLNSLRMDEPPHPLSVAYMHARRSVLMQLDPVKHAVLASSDYSRNYDQDGIIIMMDTSIYVVAASPPVPYPYKLAAKIQNLTLPYLLDRFADISLPDVMMPIQFPEIDFDIQLPDPAKPGTNENLHFYFHGVVLIFGLHGEVTAQFDATHVYFSATMDPIDFSIGSTTILQITDETDRTSGPHLTIDSQGNPNISGSFYCNFFDLLQASGDVELVNATDPTQTKFKFHIQGNAGSLAAMSLTMVYQDMNYVSASGSFSVDLTTDQLPGFSHNNTKITSSIDLSKANSGQGIQMAALMGLTLDATNPSSPNFSMNVSGAFTLSVSSGCSFDLSLPGFDIDIAPDTIATLPLTIATQIGSNAGSIFAAVLTGLPGCFVELLKLGFFVLEETEEVAKVLYNIFDTGINTGADLLSDFGSAAEDVADALWDVFGSHSSSDNTKAMKGAGYNAQEVADAIKQAVDRGGGQPYQPSNLVHDQASAGYQALQVVNGLCAAFPQYTAQPVGAGQLLSNQSLTSFTMVDVAGALKTQYPSSTVKATDMLSLLSQIYSAASLTPQQLANALAPIYPPNEVAQALKVQFPADTTTAVAMAGYLTAAYSANMNVNQLTVALAQYYGASDVAPVLHTDYPNDTSTATALCTILNAAYVAPLIPLTVNTMAAALAAVFTTPSAIVTALQTLYATDTSTAAKMAAVLMAAYPSMHVGDMAAALAAGQYPVQDIATVLQQYYSAQAGTPVQMTALLVAQNYQPAAVAPVLKALWPNECALATDVAGFLLGGYPSGSITVDIMATALRAALFSAIQIAPALKENYAGDTSTGSAMASILITAFTVSGQNTITAADMATALQASPYLAGGDGGTAKALMVNYPSDTATALALSQLLAHATYGAVDVGPVLAENYAAAINNASALAAVFAATPFTALASAPVIKGLFASGVPDAALMYSVLTTAFAAPALQAQDMANALAASLYDVITVSPVLLEHYASTITSASVMYTMLSTAYSPTPSAQSMVCALAAAPYTAVLVAPVIKAQYPGAAGTASALAGLLQNAYTSPAIDVPGMLAALAAASFGAYDVAPAVHTLYSATATPPVLGVGLVAAFAGIAPLNALPLGVALQASGFAASDIALGVKAGLADTSVGVMAALLMITADATMAQALSSTAGFKAAGDTMPVAAPKIVAAVSGMGAEVLSAALGSVFDPPATTVGVLISAVTAAYPTPVAQDIAQGALTFFPATTAADLLTALSAAYTAAGKAITPVAAATAVGAAFSYIGQPMSQPDFATMVVTAGGATATPGVVAQAIVQAYGNAAVPASIVPALCAAFSGSAVLLDARVAAASVTLALSLSPTDADKMVAPLATAFDLTVCPNNVGALAVALRTSNYSVSAVSAALSAYFGSSWSGAAFQVVGSVYTNPAWATAVAQRASGTAITAAAPAIYAANPSCDAVLMVQALAAVYDLAQTSAALQPMADALKAVVSSGQKVYTLNAASAAMAAQYSNDWNATYWQQFISYYNN